MSEQHQDLDLYPLNPKKSEPYEKPPKVTGDTDTVLSKERFQGAFRSLIDDRLPSDEVCKTLSFVSEQLNAKCEHKRAQGFLSYIGLGCLAVGALLALYFLLIDQITPYQVQQIMAVIGVILVIFGVALFLMSRQQMREINMNLRGHKPEVLELLM